MEKLQPLANQWRHKKKRRPTKKQIIAIISMTIAKRRVTALPQTKPIITIAGKNTESQSWLERMGSLQKQIDELLQ